MDGLTGLNNMELDIKNFTKDEKATAKVRGCLIILEEFFGVKLSANQFPEVLIDPRRLTSGYFPPTNTIILRPGYNYSDVAEETIHCLRENIKDGKDQLLPYNQQKMVSEFFGRLGDRIIRKLLNIKDVKDRNFSSWISTLWANLVLWVNNIQLNMGKRSLEKSIQDIINWKADIIQIIGGLVQDFNDMINNKITDNMIINDKLALATGLETLHQARFKIAQTLFSKFESSGKFLPLDVMAMNHFITSNFIRLQNLISLLKSSEISDEKIISQKSIIFDRCAESINLYINANNATLNVQTIRNTYTEMTIDKGKNHFIGYFVAEILKWGFILTTKEMITWSDQEVWQKIFLEPKMFAKLKMAGYIIN